jgi:hypothetical protein
MNVNFFCSNKCLSIIGEVTHRRVVALVDEADKVELMN